MDIQSLVYSACLKIRQIVGHQLKPRDNIANIANKLPPTVCLVHFVGNVGYQKTIANIANKLTANRHAAPGAGANRHAADAQNANRLVLA